MSRQCPAICWCFLNPNTPILGQARGHPHLSPPSLGSSHSGDTAFRWRVKTSFSRTPSASLVFILRTEVTRLCVRLGSVASTAHGERAPSPRSPCMSGGRRGLWPPAASCPSLGFLAARGTWGSARLVSHIESKSPGWPVLGKKAPTNMRCSWSHKSSEGARQVHTVACTSTATQSP